MVWICKQAFEPFTSQKSKQLPDFYFIFVQVMSNSFSIFFVFSLSALQSLLKRVSNRLTSTSSLFRCSSYNKTIIRLSSCLRRWYCSRPFNCCLALFFSLTAGRPCIIPFQILRSINFQVYFLKLVNCHCHLIAPFWLVIEPNSCYRPCRPGTEETTPRTLTKKKKARMTKESSLIQNNFQLWI